VTLDPVGLLRVNREQQQRFDPLFMRFMQLPVSFHLSGCLRQPFELVRMN